MVFELLLFLCSQKFKPFRLLLATSTSLDEKCIVNRRIRETAVGHAVRGRG